MISSGDRSLSTILQDIVRNIQEIVRSEVRLAKTELKEEAVKTKSAAVLLITGIVGAAFSAFFLLFGLVYALALVMPNWAGALIVGVVLAAIASVALTAGVRGFRQIHPPIRTVETIQENVEWAKQRTK
jgi:uncharacterized membrane protein YqjE